MAAQVFFGIVVILVLFAPALFLLYALLTDNPERGGVSVLPSHYRPETNRPRSGTRPGQCSQCGAENDVGYDYCRECGSALASANRPSDPSDGWSFGSQ